MISPAAGALAMPIASSWQLPQQPARVASLTEPSSNITVTRAEWSGSIGEPAAAEGFHAKRRYRRASSRAAATLSMFEPGLPAIGCGSSFSPLAMRLPMSASSPLWQAPQFLPSRNLGAPL